MKKNISIQIERQESADLKHPNPEKRLKELGLHTNTELTFTLFSCPIKEIVYSDENNKEKENG